MQRQEASVVFQKPRHRRQGSMLSRSRFQHRAMAALHLEKYLWRAASFFSRSDRCRTSCLPDQIQQKCYLPPQINETQGEVLAVRVGFLAHASQPWQILQVFPHSAQKQE
mmetsp:Transcript_55525/g.99934  ORF Transcript_55525/g.99934 Transcript_55525/m.99934 type:complete len:110 (-) Transcript_55525:237-566(-)